METKRKKKRTTRLPNGYGSVKKLSGNRRRPWIVSKTEGWETDAATKTIKQKKIIIGYYATRQEGLQALADYNKNPYDVDASKITFDEVYDKWSERKYAEISESNIRGYKNAFKICRPLHKIRMTDIKLLHLQTVVDESGKNTPTLKMVKCLFSQMFEYAVRNEIITKDKNISEYVDIKSPGNPNKADHIPFNSDEIALLWKNSNNEYVTIILMLIYSGVRISELLDLKKDDMSLDDRCFYIRQSKTNAGIRTVPIADKTFAFFKHWHCKNDCEYLLSSPKGIHLNYVNYLTVYWKPVLEELGLNPRPHDTRHTCISLLAAAKVYPTTIKKIVGHSGAQTLTEKVYTHLDIKELLDAINLI